MAEGEGEGKEEPFAELPAEVTAEEEEEEESEGCLVKHWMWTGSSGMTEEAVLEVLGDGGKVGGALLEADEVEEEEEDVMMPVEGVMSVVEDKVVRVWSTVSLRGAG